MEILGELDMCIQDIPRIMLNKYMLPFLMGTMKTPINVPCLILNMCKLAFWSDIVKYICK